MVTRILGITLSALTILSCSNTVVAPVEYGELTGTWRLVQNDFKKVDSRGRISNIKRTGERYISLRQVGNRVSGNINSASGSYCTGAALDGELLGNDLKMTVTFTGKCCQGGKIELAGTVDKSSSPFTFNGVKTPITTVPPKNCNFYWGEFLGFKES